VDWIAGLVFHDNVDDHELGADPKDRGFRRWRLGCCLGGDRKDEDQAQEWGEMAHVGSPNEWNGLG
jgi:hypothetical protein